MAVGTNNIADRERLRRELQSRSVLLFVTLASIGDAVITTDSDGSVTFLNPAAESLTGWKLEDAVGVDIEEVFVLIEEASGNPVPNPVRQALATVKKVHLAPDTLLVTKDGTRIPIDDSAAPIVGTKEEVLGSVLVFRDITERKRSERTIKYRSELDRMIARISSAFVTYPVMEVDIRIDEALSEIGKFFEADRAYVFLYNMSESTMICTHEWYAGGIEPLKLTTLPITLMPSWTRTIVDRRHVWISETESTPREAADERALVDHRGVKTLIAAPMSQEDRVLGFIGMEAIKESRPWPEETTDMLYLVGNIFANAIGRRDAQRKLDAAREREVEIGTRIQQSLLLSSPPAASTDFEVAALTIPSRGIDGDVYDFILHPNRNLDVVFGDVMGKGVPAALLSAGAKTEFLRSLSHLLVSSPSGNIPLPADIVNSVHSVLTPQLMNLDSFVTLSYVRFNPQSKKVLIVDCGNTRMLRCMWPDGAIESLSGFNVPLGFSASEVYEDAEYSYRAGDIFLLYSDGASEARNSEGEEYGTERLKRLVAEKRPLSPQLIVEAIRESVTGFVGSSEVADDLTCVCIAIPPGYAERQLPSSAELQVTSSLSELATIRAFLRGYCELRSTCGIDQRDLGLLELAVNEVASNIIRHAYHGRTDKHIWIRMSRENNALRVRLTHKGEAFRFTGPVTPPAIEEGREGGYGLFIISRAVDSIDFGEDTDGRQYVEIIKHLKGLGG